MKKVLSLSVHVKQVRLLNTQRHHQHTHSRTDTHQNPSAAPLVSVSTAEWVTLLFTIFPIPSQVFGLAGRPAFSLAITGLWGFSNGAFEEITLFSPSSGEKPETFGQQLVQSITRTELGLHLTHLAAKISSNLVCACVCVCVGNTHTPLL